MPTAQGAAGPVIQRLRAVPLEAVFWTAALVAAASIDPQAPGGINLCLIERLGLPCPGDGLGTAIAHLARGHWGASWNAHPLRRPSSFVPSPSPPCPKCFDTFPNSMATNRSRSRAY